MGEVLLNLVVAGGAVQNRVVVPIYYPFVVLVTMMIVAQTVHSVIAASGPSERRQVHRRHEQRREQHQEQHLYFSLLSLPLSMSLLQLA